ncbi:MAG: alanine racemase [Micavibrio sp.]|nr:alanine racemase [Micavibrio sp.]
MITAAALLDINLDAVADNIRLLQSRAPKAAMAGVVKANAYGTGMEQVAKVHRSLGTNTFFVATLDEGIALRKVLGVGPEIGILGGLFHGAEGEYPAHDLMPVLNCLGDVERWTEGRPAILHIDTGMRRLGLDTKETERLKKDPSLVANLNTAIVMSHFACADEPGHPLTPEQFAKFNDILALFPKARKSLSNSAGIFVSADYHFDLVRPGMAVYGLNPTSGEPNPMKPVVQIKTRILQIRDALDGETVGYAASHTAKGVRRIATVALGYADGFLRSLSNRGKMFWRGQEVPIVGRVSMDLVTLDVTEVQGQPVAGDWVEVLGAGQDADTLAAAAGTIGYEILTDLGNRYARSYSGKSL